jgi:hypothetical protein
LSTTDLSVVVSWGRLGGADALEAGARETKTVVRAREIKCAVDLLRLTLVYYFGDKELRLTAGWAEARPQQGLGPLKNCTIPSR